ncbi:NIN-like protein [Tanacetum coccineum]
MGGSLPIKISGQISDEIGLGSGGGYMNWIGVVFKALKTDLWTIHNELFVFAMNVLLPPSEGRLLSDEVLLVRRGQTSISFVFLFLVRRVFVKKKLQVYYDEEDKKVRDAKGKDKKVCEGKDVNVSREYDDGLTSCPTIYLRSLELDFEYVIEFFLPACSADEADLQRLMKIVKQQIKNTSCMQLDIMLAPQVIGGLPFNWNLESSPLPITLLGKKEEDMENEPSNYVVARTSLSVIPSFEKGVGESDINPGKKRRKRKRSESLIRFEEIKKHFGKMMDEAAAILHVSRSMLKRICRNLGIARWPYRSGPDKTDSLMKSDQTDITHDLISLTINGKHGPMRKNLSSETIIDNKVENVMINTIKFPFSFLDGLGKLKDLIAEKFQLMNGSLSLKYVDEDADIDY